MKKVLLLVVCALLCGNGVFGMKEKAKKEYELPKTLQLPKEVLIQIVSFLPQDEMERLAEKFPELRPALVAAGHYVPIRVQFERELFLDANKDKLRKVAKARGDMYQRIYELDLSNAQHGQDDDFCHIFTCFKSIKKVNLSGCSEVTQKTIDAAFDIDGLEVLIVDGIRTFEDAWWKKIGTKKSLVHISCARTGTTDKGLGFIHQDLKVLDISSTRAACEHMGRFHVLEELRLANNDNITSEKVVKFPKSLKRLRIGHCENFSGIGLSRFEGLQELGLIECYGLKKDVAREIFTLEHLKTLNLHKSPCMVHVLQTLVSEKKGDRLQELCVTGGERGTTVDMLKAVKQCNNLQVFRVDKVGDGEHMKDLSQLPLRELQMSVVKGFDGKGFKHLPVDTLEQLSVSHSLLYDMKFSLKHCKNLKRMSLEGLKMDDNTVQSFPESLEELLLHRCRDITGKGLERFVRLKKFQLGETALQSLQPVAQLPLEDITILWKKHSFSSEHIPLEVFLKNSIKHVPKTLKRLHIESGWDFKETKKLKKALDAIAEAHKDRKQKLIIEVFLLENRRVRQLKYIVGGGAIEEFEFVRH